MEHSSKQFQRVSASVKLGVEAMQKVNKANQRHADDVVCHNCHAENDVKRCFCSKCKTQLIHSYG